MAKIDWVEQRLLNWMRWHASGCTLGLGYGRSILASLAMMGASRSDQREAVIPTVDWDAAEVDDAVKALPSALKATVLEFYLGRGGLKDKARRLCCTQKTVTNRIEQAHRLLADHFTAKADRRRFERSRVEELQRTVE